MAWAPDHDASGVTLILEYLSACSTLVSEFKRREMGLVEFKRTGEGWRHAMLGLTAR
jgi:hypothetical protein